VYYQAMASRKPYLSKSRLISAWQCRKKLHLEKRHPELGEITTKMESLFALGHQVGAISQQIYGTPESVEIPFNRKMGLMVQETQALIDGGADDPCGSDLAMPLFYRGSLIDTAAVQALSEIFGLEISD
jgi:hypothetical protein